jgi:hypothetical protein
MIIRVFVVLVVFALTVHAASGESRFPPCGTTPPNGVLAGSTKQIEMTYGNALLSVHGVIGSPMELKLHGNSDLTRDGALKLKKGWTRAVPGKLAVTGRRLDGEAPPLRADIKCCFRETGFQSSYLMFPTPGCWEVVAQIGDVADSRLTFVMNLVNVGRGQDSWVPSKD